MSEFKGNLGLYRVIKTEDKSETLYSEFFDEACHNLSGAYDETIHNYINGCAIPDKLNQLNTLSIFDVGFGLGVGLKTLMDTTKNSKKVPSNIFYYSVELDEFLFLWAIEKYFTNFKFEKFELSNLRGYKIKISELNLIACIFIGDARVTIPMAKELGLITTLNAIFQDPFSPKKNPALWSVEWFTLLKSLSCPDVTLTTYSSSISIRKSLIASGWEIENLKGFGQKRTMTRANLIGPTHESILDQLKRSPSLEIRDK